MSIPSLIKPPFSTFDPIIIFIYINCFIIRDSESFPYIYNWHQFQTSNSLFKNPNLKFRVGLFFPSLTPDGSGSAENRARKFSIPLLVKSIPSEGTENWYLNWPTFVECSKMWWGERNRCKKPGTKLVWLTFFLSEVYYLVKDHISKPFRKSLP